MKKILLGGASAVAVAVIAFSGPAHAACSWNGYNWDCASPRTYYQPYANQYGYQPSYGYAQPQPYYYGQYPQWDSTRYPGPKTGGSRGY